MVLNFPVGDAVVHLAPLSQFDAERVFELQKQKFSGYLVATIEGASGVEEGLLFLLEGKVVACAYSLDAFDIISYAQTGLQLFFYTPGGGETNNEEGWWLFLLWGGGLV